MGRRVKARNDFQLCFVYRPKLAGIQNESVATEFFFLSGPGSFLMILKFFVKFSPFKRLGGRAPKLFYYFKGQTECFVKLKSARGINNSQFCELFQSP